MIAIAIDGGYALQSQSIHKEGYMRKTAVTPLLCLAWLLSGCAGVASTPDPNSVVIWCPDCAESGVKIYLGLLPDKYFPDWSMEVYHGDKCTLVTEGVAKDIYWYIVDPSDDPATIRFDDEGRPYEFYPDVNVPVALLECDRIGGSGWMFIESLKRESEIPK